MTNVVRAIPLLSALVIDSLAPTAETALTRGMVMSWGGGVVAASGSEGERRRRDKRMNNGSG